MTTADQLIILWHMRPEDGSKLDIPCAQFYRGWTIREYWDIESPGWHYQDEWSTGYREVYTNSEQRAVFTYCEGDLDLTIDADDETFQRRLASAAEFYRRVA